MCNYDREYSAFGPIDVGKAFLTCKPYIRDLFLLKNVKIIKCKKYQKNYLIKQIPVGRYPSSTP